ncbi:MAG TPA: alpha/beta hydrolase [Streptosporangiaceae bacterium]|nr:alpha/beta hydrolase [Streptosporangiaceae bacterium]
MADSTQPGEPVTGFGTVHGVPGLPAGFAGTFESRLTDVAGVRLHTVSGGDGPPLLLVGGWPQTWYVWRLVMPRLAEDFRVIAVDPRGVGVSDTPDHGYDSATLASELVALMDTLGHRRFVMIGHDVGMWTAYAAAADHPDRIERLVLAEANIPGVAPSPPLLGPEAANDRLWHFAFNRKRGLNEELVRGREHLYFGDQFAAKAAVPLPEAVVDFYVQTLARSADALRASFEFYRAIDEIIAQNERRRAYPLAMPVLTLAGEQSLGARVGEIGQIIATDPVNVVIGNCGHYLPEEQPEALLAELIPFLEPYRAG